MDNYVRSKLCIERHGSMCKSSIFTVAIKDGTPWVYVDYMCDSVKNYTSCQDFFQLAIPKLGFMQCLKSERKYISKLKLMLLLFVTVTFCYFLFY